jgi:hypothetical protein
MVRTEVSPDKIKAEVRVTIHVAHIFLGFLLLSNVDFQDIFATVGPKQSIISGLGPFNSSIENGDPTFLVYSDLNSLLQSPQNAFSVPSPNGTSCDECFSYILPGTLNGIGLLPNGTSPASGAYEGATHYISKNSPTYQLDYYPLSNIDFPWYACHVYGELKICQMNINGDLVTGLFP